jgi:tRNA G26 N,N-dimethylase Trm1
MKVIKVSDHVYERIKQLAEQKNISLNNVVEELLNIVTAGHHDTKPIKKIYTRDISLMWDDKCDRCGRELKRGEIAHYTRIEYEDGSVRKTILCYECYLPSTALAKQYLQIKKYEQIVKGLKAEADQLVQLIEQARLFSGLAETKEQINSIVRELNNAYVVGVISKQAYDELKAKLEEIIAMLNDFDSRLRLVEKFFGRLLFKAKKAVARGVRPDDAGR